MVTRGGAVRLLLLLVSMLAVTACSSVGGAPSIRALQRATVLVEHDTGHGTGSIIAPDLILTAAHVVEGDEVDVSFHDGEWSAGHLMWHDAALDLALLKADVPEGYEPTSISCRELESGQFLVLVGHPTQSRWVAIGGHLPETKAFEGDLVLLGFPIGLGTSGGPVFDNRGRVVGVALAILAERSSESATFGDLKDTGLGLMLPASVFCANVGTAAARNQPLLDDIDTGG